MTIPVRVELISFFDNMKDEDLEILLEYASYLPRNLNDLLDVVQSAVNISKPIECELCRQSMPFAKALSEGWLPETWYSHNEPGPAPACPSCMQRFFTCEADSNQLGDSLRPPGEWLC